MIGLVFLLAGVGMTPPSLESLNAADLAVEVRPGGVNGSPFWNAFAWQFIYAPAFDFKPVDGAATYRFRLTDAQGCEHVFCADSPQASLAPVWKDVAPGAARLEVTALDAGGQALGLVATNGFHRSAPFRPGAYPPAVCGYGTCAERALDWMFRSRWVNGWASGEVDKTYQLNCYPSKMVPATMLAMVEYAKRHPEDRQKAMRIAENAADWMMANSVKEPEAMRGLPITYLDYYEETKHLGDVWNSKKIAHEKRDQVMMIYPASVGKAYLGLFKATGKRKYFEYARTIADRYLALQRQDGSWALVLEFPSGREVSSNAAGETGICEFLDEMGGETGDVRYRQASDRAIPAMVRRIREFDWEGQFEDTAVQRVRYANLSKHIAAETMLYLLDRFPDGRYAKDAREVLRFAEDQFVAWSHPWGERWYTPGVIEQYNCRVTIDSSYAKMIRFYLKMYEVERNPLDLAKARALGDAITRNQQPDGLIPTVFPNDPGRAGRHWLNCMMATIRALLELEGVGTDVSVVDFGARTEADATANRAAIQRAIDAAAERGGRVIVPQGRWWTGSLQLKSGVELHLEKGAVLLGSTNRVDYNENTVFPENAFSVAEEWSGGHLVWAYRAHDIAITGEGVIDGNGPAFFGDCDEDSRFPYYKYGLKLHPLDTEWYRPGQMLAFYQVKNLRLEDVTLANTTAWTCHVRCSDGFVARGVKILADRTIANSDGFSIDCTRNALVEKCTVRSGDDGFAIRAACRHHAATNACEDIVVRDCDVWSCCYGFRFGIGSGDIRKVRVENCRIHESANGFGFVPSWIKGERGVHFRDVTVRNCSLCESERPVCIGPGSSRSSIRDIRFENCRFEALAPSRIVGNDVCDVDGFVFTNCTYRRIGKVKVRQSGMGADSLERARIFAETNAWVKNVRFENCVPGPVRPGVLVLAFDDRRFADWEKAMPLFAKYDAHATFFISGEIGADVIGSVKRLVRAGHSVGLHGQHHLDAPEAIREKGYAWYRSSEIDHPRRQLQVSLLRTFAFAYPNNARTDETDRALLQDFRRLRAGVPGAAPYDPEGKKQSGRIPLHENDALFFPVDELRSRRVISGAIIGEAYHTKIDEVLKCLERAAKNREVVEFTSHGISPDAKRINMKTEWLEAILAKAQELGLEVLSFDELDRPNGGQ